MLTRDKNLAVFELDQDVIQYASITTTDGHKLPWVKEIRYLGVHITQSRKLRCSLNHAKQSFYQSINAIFWKIGRTASEEVILELVKSKCLPISLYGLECFSQCQWYQIVGLYRHSFPDEKFKSSNINLINDSRYYFNFELPSEFLMKRKDKFSEKIMASQSLLDYFAIQ